MNRKQRNHLASHAAVEAVLEDHATDVATIPGLPAKVEAFQAKLGEIHRLAVTQIQPIQPSTVESERLLEDMVDASLGIAGVVTTVAREQARPELARSVRVSRAMFRRLPRQHRVWLAQRVLDVARTLTPDLEVLGVTAETLTEMQAQIDAASDGVGLPRGTIVTKRVATVDLEALLGDVGAQLADEIDRLLFLHRKKIPALYTAYRAARVVVDRIGGGGGGGSVSAAPTAPAVIAPASAPVEINPASPQQQQAA